MGREVRGKFYPLAYLSSAVFFLALPLAGEAFAPEHGGDLAELGPREVLTRFQERLAPARFRDAKRLARVVIAEAKVHRLSPALVLAVIETESSFRYDALSPAGAVGLMQLKPSTAAYVAALYRLPYEGPEDLTDPVRNLRIGIAYLAHLKRRFGHSEHYLAAYNLGPARLAGRLRRDEGIGSVASYVDRIHGRTRGMQSQAARLARANVEAARLARANVEAARLARANVEAARLAGGRRRALGL